MKKMVFVLVIVCMASIGYSSTEIPDEKKMKIAKEMGFENYKSLDAIAVVIKENGNKAKKFLYFVGSGSSHYYLNQKQQGYTIYTVSDRYRNFVSTKTIVVEPLKGEQIVKGASLPGGYYELLDGMDMTMQDGFTKKVPLIRRVLTKEEKKGYGNPPNDNESRKMIIGTWQIEKSDYGTDRFTFKADRTLDVVEFSDSTPKGLHSTGTWKIENTELRFSYESAPGKYVTSLENAGGRIIKLTNDTLVVQEDSERWYKRKKE